MTDQKILNLAELALDKTNPREWHWALMDYGAYLRSNPPAGGPNPNRRHKNYRIQSKFEGSFRQIRGTVLRNLVDKKMTAVKLAKIIGKDKKKTNTAISALEKEGSIKQRKKVYFLPS